MRGPLENFQVRYLADHLNLTAPQIRALEGGGILEKMLQGQLDPDRFECLVRHMLGVKNYTIPEAEGNE